MKQHPHTTKGHHSGDNNTWMV